MAGLNGLLAENLFSVVRFLPYSPRKIAYLVRCLNDYSAYFDFTSKHCGEREAMKRCKAAFKVGLSIALEQHEQSQLSKRGYPLGFPKKLQRILSWLRGSYDRRRVALTILSSYRLMEGKAYNDFSSIMSAPPNRFKSEQYLRKEVRLLRNFRFHRKLRTYDPSRLVMLSRGPYGSECSMESALAASSLLACPKECSAVLRLWKASGTPMSEGIRYLMNSACVDFGDYFRVRYPDSNPRNLQKRFRLSDNAVDGAYYFRRFVGVQQWIRGSELEHVELSPYTFPPNNPFPSTLDMSDEEVEELLLDIAETLEYENLGSPFLARLTFVPKEGGGTRPVTPTNMFIQSALTPVHDLFMSFTSAQRGDCTYDESSVHELLCRITRNSGESFSFDWTSATDFVSVVDHLYPIVSEVLGDSIAKPWLTLMKIQVAMDFCKPDRSKSVRFTPPIPLRELSDELKTKPGGNPSVYNLFNYDKGSPMGIRSLWPVFAVFHHCLRALGDRLATQAPGRFIEPPADLGIYDTNHAVRVLFRQSGDGFLYLKNPPVYGQNPRDDASKCHRELSLTKGDDQWLKGRLRSYLYLTLCDVSGFEISRGKSVVTKAGSPSSAEFSKRYFVRGREITPVSPKAVYEAFTKEQPLLAYEVSSSVIAFYEDHPGKKVTATEAAGLSFSRMLSRRSSSLLEFAVWASCPLHSGRYDSFLDPMGLLIPWPIKDHDALKNVLARSIRDAMTRLIGECSEIAKALHFEDYGVSVSDLGMFISDRSPLVKPLKERGVFVPHEVASLASLFSELNSATEVDFLTGKTLVSRTVEQVVNLVSNLQFLKGSKRRHIRFELSRGPVCQAFKVLSEMKCFFIPRELFPLATRWLKTKNIEQLHLHGLIEPREPP